MKKYKIVLYRDLGNWFVYKRYLIFFWSQVNYFIKLQDALEYIGIKESYVVN